MQLPHFHYWLRHTDVKRTSTPERTAFFSDLIPSIFFFKYQVVLLSQSKGHSRGGQYIFSTSTTIASKARRAEQLEILAGILTSLLGQPVIALPWRASELNYWHSHSSCYCSWPGRFVFDIVSRRSFIPQWYWLGFRFHTAEPTSDPKLFYCNSSGFNKVLRTAVHVQKQCTRKENPIGPARWNIVKNKDSENFMEAIFESCLPPWTPEAKCAKASLELYTLKIQVTAHG